MDLFKKQQKLKPYFETAYGCAVFEQVAKAGFGIGGAGGNGEVYVFGKGKDNVKKVGGSTLLQVSFGFQFGGQVFSEIIFFASQKDFENFTQENFEFSADANVVALNASASAKVSTMGNQSITVGMSPDKMELGYDSCQYTNGMAVFTVALGGLMYEATVSGQKFTYKPTDGTPAVETVTE